MVDLTVKYLRKIGDVIFAALKSAIATEHNLNMKLASYSKFEYEAEI